MMGVDLPVVPMLHQYIVMDRIEQFASLDHELPLSVIPMKAGT